uniref:Reverse transcriptase domain-containing protein n=1 Tax=Tanacetum cinerariifolium TaxID=118510 RepID=A0A6L2L9C4_TANCI|nr:reverse transcriptase domain-containing protein [Tanacetum cinerariifolium]
MLTCQRTSQVRSHHQNFGEAGMSKDMPGSGDKGRMNKNPWGPTEPVLQTQKPPSPFPAFIKENIDVLRTMIKERDQQAKMKATPRKLAYVDSDNEALARRQNKGLQAFMDRFKSESSHIKEVPPFLHISAFMHGHGHPKLAKKLNDKIPKTVDEMFERVRAFIRGEVVAGSAEMVHPSQGDKGGHNTNDCNQLKKQIEEVVASGKLTHLMKDIRWTNKRNGSQGRNNVKGGSMGMLAARKGARLIEGRFLGYMVTKEGVRADPEKYPIHRVRVRFETTEGSGWTNEAEEALQKIKRKLHKLQTLDVLKEGLAVSVSKGMKDLHVFMDSPKLVAQTEGNHTPAMEQEMKYMKEIMDATNPFYRFQITRLPKILNSKAEVLTRLATIKLEFLNQEVSVGIKTRPLVEETIISNKG